MFVFALLVILFAPRGIEAAPVWKWQDPSGTVHFSNIPGHVPSDAVQVRERTGLLAGLIHRPDPKLIEANLERMARMREEQARDQLEQGFPAPWAVPPLVVPSVLPEWFSSGTLPAWPVADCPLPAQPWLIRAVTQLHLRRCPAC